MKKLQFFRQTARWQRRALLCLLTAGSLWSFAQPDESKTYHIRSFTTDKVVSNFNNGDNDCSCLWLIIILVLLFCCCGSWGGNSCGCDTGCGC